MKIGVIIGRFQVPELHPGHIDLLETVNGLSEKMVILIGTTVAKNTQRDPLDYNTRELMLSNAYWFADIHPLADQKTNEYWSESIDNLLLGLYPNDDITLYGMRDSFIPCYAGKIPVVELPAKDTSYNATVLRKLAGQKPIDHPYFRMGCIYQSIHRYPISYQAVDLAILNPSADQILLGRREHETQWRFPGGIVDPTDSSLETAIAREAAEEVPGAQLTRFEYISSRRVKDYRYINREDQIMTAFYQAFYMGGEVRAGDDLFEVKWFDIKDLLSFWKTPLIKNILVGEHIYLMEELLTLILKEKRLAA
jgi:bifunctional NMN adenylyltransferase/nudix hydrolase